VETTAQVIVPYLFALEKHKSAHENRYSSIVKNNRSRGSLWNTKRGNSRTGFAARGFTTGNACLAF
jgi:hypothetical protein